MSIIPLPYRLIALALLALGLIVGAVALKHHYDAGQQAIGEQRVQAKWDAERARLAAAALAEQQAKDIEGQRRIEIQQRNQDAQDKELAAARAAADRNAADADRVREQSTAAARNWSERLADSPAREDLAAAGATIGMLTDMLGRADQTASVQAAFADASRAAGLKCERDYDALSGKP